MSWPNFALTNGQQAPVAPRHASRVSPCHTASTTRKRIAGHSTVISTARLTSVSAACSGVANSRQRSQAISPRSARGGGRRGAMRRRTEAAAMSALHPCVRAVVPVHGGGGGKRDRQIHQHGNGDDLGRLAGLIERSAGEEREEIGVADGDGK